jgi:hypothetical protein
MQKSNRTPLGSNKILVLNSTFSKIYQQVYNRFAGIIDKPFLCLLWLLLFDALANPYAGLVHDSRLYALQAMSLLNPDMFANDLYFQFGSQDAFSIFSLIHSQFVRLFGVYSGTAFLYTISRGGFLLSALIFLRHFFNDRFKAFFVVCLITCGPLHYISFDINEPFLTPRIAALGLSMLGFSSAFRQAPIASMLFILLAGLMHPLITLAPAVIIFFYWLINHNRKALMIMAGGGCLGILVLLLKTDALLKLNFFDVIDIEWWKIIRNRSTYLFPFEWTRDEWYGLFAGLLALIFSFRYLNKIQKQFLSLVLACVISGILLTLLTAYIIPLALPFQLQIWRSSWILRIVSPAIAIIWGQSLWQQGQISKRIAALIVMLPTIFNGGVVAGNFNFVLIAGVLDFLPLTRLNHAISDEFASKVLVVVGSMLSLLPFLMFLPNFQNVQSDDGWRMLILSLVAVSGPILRSLFLMLPLMVQNSKPFIIEWGLIILIGGLWFSGISPDAGYPLVIQTERNIIRTKPLAGTISRWSKNIPLGSTILTDGSIPLENIWFDFKSCSYYSWEQGAGIVFNRNLALAYEQRKNEVKMGTANNWRSWCKNQRIDFVVTRKKLSSTPLNYYQGIRLYAVNL